MRSVAREVRSSSWHRWQRREGTHWAAMRQYHHPLGPESRGLRACACARAPRRAVRPPPETMSATTAATATAGEVTGQVMAAVVVEKAASGRVVAAE
eukprot:3870234-Prymnesium_polylepis.1